MAAAGDVYADDLKFGVCVLNLCGHWKDELISLEKGLAKPGTEKTELQS